MKVFIIDDDEDICAILGLLFKNRKWDFRYATSGATALDQMRSDPPDVIFLDLVMPQMGGEEVMRLIQNDPLLSMIPVIFLTAKELSQPDRAHLMGIGARGIYIKPIDPADIVEKAFQLLK